MRKVLLVLVALCAFGGFSTETVLAKDGHPISVNLSVEVWSQYMCDGADFTDSPVVQTDLFIGLPKGFYVDLWWSAGLDGQFFDMSSDLGDEVDYTFGWSGLVYENVTLDVGVSYFDIFEIGNTNRDVLQMYANVSYPLELPNEHTLTVHFEVEQHLPINWPSADGGVHLYLGAHYDWAMADALTMSNTAQLIYDAGVTGFDSGFLVEYEVGFNWQIFDQLVFTPIQARASLPLHAMMDDRQFEASVGASVQYSF